MSITFEVEPRLQYHSPYPDDGPLQATETKFLCWYYATRKQRSYNGLVFDVVKSVDGTPKTVSFKEKYRDPSKGRNVFSLRDREDVSFEMIDEESALPIINNSRSPSAFVEAVVHAYSCHCPFVFNPDHVWNLILQGLTAHIDTNPEEMRHHFVQHEGKKEIVVRRDHFVLDANNDWTSTFPEFSQKIGEFIGKKHSLLRPTFSTTTPQMGLVHDIALMGAMKNYFSYTAMTMCGIPSMTLEGTREDWESIRERVNFFETEFRLSWSTTARLKAAACGATREPKLTSLS